MERPDVGESEGPPARPAVARHLQDRPDPGGVDELHRGQVDDDVWTELLGGGGQHRRGGKVELAADAQDGGVVRVGALDRRVAGGAITTIGGELRGHG